jgi:hypothetical protein
MTLVARIPDNSDIKKVAKLNKIDAGKNISGSTDDSTSEDHPTRQKLKVEFKEALNDAFDIVEGKKPRKTLKDIFNG